MHKFVCIDLLIAFFCIKYMISNIFIRFEAADTALRLDKKRLMKTLSFTCDLIVVDI